jgi:porin
VATARSLGTAWRFSAFTLAALAAMGAARPASGLAREARTAPEALRMAADSLEPKLRFSGTWTQDAHQVLAGPAREGYATQHHLLLSAEGRARLGAGGRIGAEGHLSVMVHGGHGIADRVLDVQGVSNIEAPPTRRLYEAWIEASLGGGRWQLLVGLYDVNRDFYALDASGIFLNGAHGIGPEFGLTGTGGPSIYPATALALRIQGAPAPGLTLRAALVDGAPGAPGSPSAWGLALSREEGALLVGEADVTALEPVRVAAGAWAYSTPLRPQGVSGAAWESRGTYVLAEAPVAGCGGGPCLRAFARVGRAEPRINPVGAAFGVGLLLEARDGGPALGVAWAGASPGAAEAAAGSAPSATEENLEVTARIPVFTGVELLPDLQVVDAPGMDHASPRAVVLSLRVSAAF